MHNADRKLTPKEFEYEVMRFAGKYTYGFMETSAIYQILEKVDRDDKITKGLFADYVTHLHEGVDSGRYKIGSTLLPRHIREHRFNGSAPKDATEYEFTEKQLADIYDEIGAVVYDEPEYNVYHKGDGTMCVFLG